MVWIDNIVNTVTDFIVDNLAQRDQILGPRLHSAHQFATPVEYHDVSFSADGKLWQVTVCDAYTWNSWWSR
jgi:hypothetical protein